MSSSSGPEPNINLFPTAIQNGHINLIIRCVIGLADEPPTPSDGIKSGCPPFRRGIKLRRVLVMAHSDVGRRDASPTSSMKSVFYAVKHQVKFSTSSSSRTWCRLRLGVRAAAPSSVCTVRSHEYGIVSCASGPRGRSYVAKPFICQSSVTFLGKNSTAQDWPLWIKSCSCLKRNCIV